MSSPNTHHQPMKDAITTATAISTRGYASIAMQPHRARKLTGVSDDR